MRIILPRFLIFHEPVVIHDSYESGLKQRISLLSRRMNLIWPLRILNMTRRSMCTRRVLCLVGIILGMWTVLLFSTRRHAAYRAAWQLPDVLSQHVQCVATKSACCNQTFASGTNRAALTETRCIRFPLFHGSSPVYSRSGHCLSTSM